MKLPTVLLINGLLQFQPGALTPLAPIASDLQALGFRVVIDNHLQTWHADEEPVAVIGHSRGGGVAYQFQKQQRDRALFVPFVITFDAAPAGPCHVRGKCVNIKSDYYFEVPGAENIRLSRYTSKPVVHSLLPQYDAAREIVRKRLRPFAQPMR